ncbi:hypothetical protein FRX31_012500 [Thalictrum thalictroides]|uniref:Uncharacterized protein n=1 Tax=Thalictrum thalictroides TaxID=46969 RepID=A0A7J6WLR1_THATH|nr:hypothetical protein FRX31_012500 [Thalictrum thalictroides]
MACSLSQQILTESAENFLQNQLGRRFWINTLKSMIGIQADMWWTASIQAACGGVQWFTYELHSQI